MSAKMLLIIYLFLSLALPAWAGTGEGASIENQLLLTVEPSFESYVDPRGAFSLNIPVGWNMFELSAPAQRVLIFASMDFSTFEYSSIDDLENRLRGAISISLMRIDGSLGVLSNEAEEVLRETKARKRENGQLFILMQQSPIKLGTYEAISQTATYEENGEKKISDYMLAYADNYYVLISIGSKKSDLVAHEIRRAEVLKSFKLLHKELINLELGGVKNEENRVFLNAPVSWYRKEHFDKDVYQLFISREKIKEPKQSFDVGITVNKIFNFKEHFPEISAMLEPESKVYIYAYVNSIPEPKHVGNGDIFDLNGVTCRQAEVSFKSGKRFITSLVLVTYKENTLVTVVFEAPTVEFEQYRETFSKIKSSLAVF